MRCEVYVNIDVDEMLESLNPCFSGICAARRFNLNITIRVVTVLILVLVEYALREKFVTAKNKSYENVLILVLVEYALRGRFESTSGSKHNRLNPCFSGICAARDKDEFHLFVHEAES